MPDPEWEHPEHWLVVDTETRQVTHSCCVQPGTDLMRALDRGYHHSFFTRMRRRAWGTSTVRLVDGTPASLYITPLATVRPSGGGGITVEVEDEDGEQVVVQHSGVCPDRSGGLVVDCCAGRRRHLQLVR